MSGSLPAQGRLAGIDYGTVRVGVAISDPQQLLSSPLTMLARESPAADAARFRRLVAEEGIVGFVVGLPVHTSGEESEKSREARRFGAWLRDTTGLPVGFYDERFTTQVAERQLQQAGLTRKKRQQRRDMLAAHGMLAAFLESTRSEGAAALEDPDENRVR